MNKIETAQQVRMTLIAKRDRAAMLGQHKKRCAIERELRLQTCEVLRQWAKEKGGD